MDGKSINIESVTLTSAGFHDRLSSLIAKIPCMVLMTSFWVRGGGVGFGLQFTPEWHRASHAFKQKK